MCLTFVSAENPALVAGLRIGAVAGSLNQLLAELEADTATPAAVIDEVHVAYHALNRAALPLLDRAIQTAKAKGHYTDLAAQAMHGAA
jgi:hypothetical protein